MIEPSSPVVVPMAVRDLDEVHRLATLCFSSPWDRDVFEAELCRDWAHLWVLRPGLGEPIAAFVSFWLIRDEIHVLNLGTDPALRRRGHARRLLEEMLAFGRHQGVHYISLEVRQKNRAAQALYAAAGFEPIGVRPHYYEDDEDAVVMLRHI